MSLAISCKKVTEQSEQLSKGLMRFQKEDPTFHVHQDPESKETLISGMGELHLDVYCERLRREYKVDVFTGPPRVNYRETCVANCASPAAAAAAAASAPATFTNSADVRSCGKKVDFTFTHKKQTGGIGQYAKLVGYIEPIANEDEGFVEEAEAAETAGTQKKKKKAKHSGVVFENQLSGNAIPPEFIAAIEKGLVEGSQKGACMGFASGFTLPRRHARGGARRQHALRAARRPGPRRGLERAVLPHCRAQRAQRSPCCALAYLPACLPACLF
jgi:elongation factor G